MSDRTFSFDGMTFSMGEFNELGKDIRALISDGQKMTWPNLTHATYQRINWDWYMGRVYSVEVRMQKRLIRYPDFRIERATKIRESGATEIIGRLVPPLGILLACRG